MASPVIALTPVSPTSLVHSVNGLIGTVTLTPAIIGAAPAMGADDNYVTDAEKVVLGNTSGTNTGDQTATTVPNTPAGNIAATNVQAAINELDSEKIAVSTKGAANGVASLDASGLVPVTQLPPAALERLVVVANQAARYALTTASVQNGDTIKQDDTGEMWYVVDDTQLNGAGGYSIYTAGTASAVAVGGITGLAAGIAAFLATPSGANLLAALTTKTGTGLPVFADAPTLTNPLVTTQSDNDATTKAASTAFTKAQIAADAGFFALPNGVETTYMASGASGIRIPDNANLDVGTGDFSLRWIGILPSYPVSANTRLIRKLSGAFTGYSLFFLTDNTVDLRLYRNDSGTQYTASMGTIIPDNSICEIVSVCTRETAGVAGSVSHYLNGVLLGTVPITAGTPYNLDNSGAVYLLGTDTAWDAGTVISCQIFNYALSASQVLSLYRNGIQFDNQRGSVTADYTSDFSAGEDGWAAATGCTVAGNIDAIGGLNDWLRMTLDTGASVHWMRRVAAVIVPGRRYRMAYSYYIPSTNAVLDGIRITNENASIALQASIVTVKDTVTTVSFDFVAPTQYDGFALVGYNSSGSPTFTGNGTDVCYIRGITVTPLGARLNLEPEGIQPNQWHDSSVNELHAIYPTSYSLLRWKDRGQYNWTTAITGDTTLTSIVPAGYELEKIVFLNSTANAVSVRLGTTAAGTDVFGLTALNTSATLGGFKTILCNQGFSLTVAQTLYLSSTSWNSASLTATFYFRRIS